MIKSMSASAGKKITAQEVKELREKTGASIMECRNALEKCGGNPDMAMQQLKMRGKEKAKHKADRETGEGVVAAYIHSNGKIGAMVELRCETDFVAKNVEFKDLAYDIAMHIAALAPAYLSVDKVSEKDKDEYEHLVREELAGEKKPDNVIEKIVSGKIKKHFEDLSLMDQNFVKNPEITVKDLLNEKIAKVGENIQIGDFTRFLI